MPGGQEYGSFQTCRSFPDAKILRNQPLCNWRDIVLCLAVLESALRTMHEASRAERHRCRGIAGDDVSIDGMRPESQRVSATAGRRPLSVGLLHIRNGFRWTLPAASRPESWQSVRAAARKIGQIHAINPFRKNAREVWSALDESEHALLESSPTD